MLYWKYEKEFRKAHPQTVGESDQEFDLDNYREFLEKRLEEAEAERERLVEHCKTNEKQRREGLPPLGVVPAQTYKKGFDVGYNLAAAHTYSEIINIMNKPTDPTPGTETPDQER